MKYEPRVNDFFCGAKATEVEEVTDLSDAPTEIKAQILENDRKLRERAKTSKSQILTGDAQTLLRSISDNSVDCCVTSPPYYGLRDYGIEGQVGLEENPQEYINKLVEVFREVRRVLHTDGTLWLNIGDSYAGSRKGRNKDGAPCKGHSISRDSNNKFRGTLLSSKTTEYKRKELMGIPWRLAFALQSDGWYLRQDIIWLKPNCMPESVKDRCTKSHEYIFLLSKSDKYYFDCEAIKEPAVGFDNRPPAGSRGAEPPNSRARKRETENVAATLRNKRDVWSVPTHGYKEAHFATFPEKLIEPCVLAGSRAGGIVLDPFIGSGTTAVVAEKHGREYIGIDINPEYAEMARRRLRTGGGTDNT